jgi:hypothetical protein
MSLASGLGEQQPWRLLLHGGDAGSGRSSLAVGVWRTDPVGGGRHRRLVSPLTPPPRPPCQGAADLSPGHGRLLPTWGGIWRGLPYPMDGVWRPDPAHGGRHRHLGGPAPHLLPHKAWRLSSTAATTSSSTTSCVLLHDATLLVRCSSGLPDVAPPSQGRLVGRRHGRPAGLHIVFLEKMFAVRLLGSTRRSLRICSSAVGSIIFCRELSLAHRKDFSPCV